MKFLIPFDFSTISENALHQAIHLMNDEKVEIFVIHIVDQIDAVYSKKVLLTEAISRVQVPKNITIHTHVYVGSVYEDIGKLAESHEVDLVIMGTHGVDLAQRLFGSHVVKIVKNSTVPFVVLQENCSLNDLKKIVMPISIEKKSIQVLKYVAKFAKLFNAEVHSFGRMHTDDFLKRKENVNVLLINDFLNENKITHHFEIIEVNKSNFEDELLDYAQSIGADMLATTYFSDSILPVFDKFVQNLVVNSKGIPVMCVNATSLSKVDSTLSFMTI